MTKDQFIALKKYIRAEAIYVSAIDCSPQAINIVQAGAMQDKAEAALNRAFEFDHEDWDLEQ